MKLNVGFNLTQKSISFKICISQQKLLELVGLAQC